jgi:membrane protein required for colicin V production
MNFIDIVMLIGFAYAAFRGFTKGFVLQIVTFIAIIVGIWASIKFSGAMADFLTAKLDITGKYLPVLAFILVFILVIIIAHLVGMLLTKVFEIAALGWLNRLGGVAFAVLKMAFIISVILAVLQGFKGKFSIISEKQQQESILYKPVACLAPAIFPHLKFKDLETQWKHITAPVKKKLH